jgi:Flp pilus assembly protein TadD
MTIDPNAMFQQARQAYLSGQTIQAHELLITLQSRIDANADILHLLGLVEAKLGDMAAAEVAFAKAIMLAPAKTEFIANWARTLRDRGEFRKAEKLLKGGLKRFPKDQTLLAALGLLAREEDRRDEAAIIFDDILKITPNNAHALHSRARIELERGLDARCHYERARAAAPSDKQIILGAAASLYQQGDADAAIKLLHHEVETQPDWIEGLQTLARMRWQRGEESDFADAYERALSKQPKNSLLWASYLRMLASALGSQAILNHLHRARRQAGCEQIFDMLEAESLSEIGEHEEAEKKFELLEPITDPWFIPVRMRSFLRTHRPEAAALLGEQFTSGTSANFIWPYLGLAWRLSDDPRWQWLDRYQDTVGIMDLEELLAILPDLGELLRQLHCDSRHPFDQSPRGGTQTDGALLQRMDPLIVQLRTILAEAVGNFIDGLPPIEANHPFLGRSRRPFAFAGSWSIRLLDKGYHISHVHPMGWLSSALYISLPDRSCDTDPHSGWLALGVPPQELGLNLPPVRLVEPKEGRLILFPSIMWHETIPFEAGERLTCAFDIVPRTIIFQ